MKKVTFFTIATLITGLFFTACSEDDSVVEPVEPLEPSLENIEIGLNNNELGVIGRDFHFNAEVQAGELIDYVQIKIQQRNDQTYSHEWNFEITWDEYKGLRNTIVHKHFDIPGDAAEGIYDFVIIVKDQNGAQLEVTRELNIYLPENLPVDPQLENFNISKNYEFFYRNGEFLKGSQFVKNDTLSAQASIGGVKGNGKMYLLLINKASGHRPETIDGIDFSKAIVYDVFEHENEEQVYSFSNAIYDLETFTWIRKIPKLVIGAVNDNSTPRPNPIDGEKAWTNGTYYFGLVYTNTTYDVSLYHYIEFKVEGF